MWLVEENTSHGVLFFGNTCQGGILRTTGI